MAKSLLLWSVVLVLAGGAAFAEPLPEPPLFVVEQEEPAPALCLAQELNGFPAPQPKGVPICAGDPCTKTSDCRPPGLPECAQCWCIGPAGDKWCGCI